MARGSLLLQVVCSTVHRVWIGHVGLGGPRRGIHSCALLVLHWPWTAGWFEAVGTWFAGLVAAGALVSAVVAFKSEDFARRLEEARANRDERAKLQQEADLVRCIVGRTSGNQVEPGIVETRLVDVRVENRSSYMVMPGVQYADIVQGLLAEPRE